MSLSSYDYELSLGGFNYEWHEYHEFNGLRLWYSNFIRVIRVICS